MKNQDAKLLNIIRRIVVIALHATKRFNNNQFSIINVNLFKIRHVYKKYILIIFYRQVCYIID